MTCYIITFQAKELKTRDAIRARLREYDSYCPIHNTCWAVLTDEKAADIRDSVGAILAPGDRVFVVRSGTEGAWRRAGTGAATSEWLKKNL